MFYIFKGIYWRPFLNWGSSSLMSLVCVRMTKPNQVLINYFFKEVDIFFNLKRKVFTYFLSSFSLTVKYLFADGGSNYNKYRWDFQYVSLKSIHQSNGFKEDIFMFILGFDSHLSLNTISLPLDPLFLLAVAFLFYNLFFKVFIYL